MQESAETFRQYGSVLEKSCSTRKDERQQAEATIKQMMATPGFGFIALKFLTLDQAPPPLKQASAVLFKNLVKEHWSNVNDKDKAQIKSNILPFLLSGPPPQLRTLLSEAVTLMAQQDFPQMWPNLVSELVQRSNTQDTNVLLGILRTAHSVFRRYRNVSSSQDVLKELKFILEQFQRPLLNIYMQCCQAFVAQPADIGRQTVMAEALNLCTKLFYDLNYVDLPEFFEDHMKEWMTGFLQFLHFRSTVPKLLGEEDKAGVLLHLQKNVCMVLTLYSTKYDEEFTSYLEGFVQAVWKLLTECLDANQPRFESIVAHGVAFLTAVANGPHHRLFGNGEIMKSVCQKIVIPCMMLKEDDVELFEDEPMEYVKQDIEGSDLDTRRRSARELVKGLRKNYEREVTGIFGSYIETLLSQYKSNMKSFWKAKDVAVFLLTAVAVSTYRQATGANSVNPMVPLLSFYHENVMPDLNKNSHPILQADALKFIITFRNHIPPTEYSQLIPAIAGMLKSESVVVHTYAANAIDNLLTIKDKNPNGPGYTHRITKENLEPMLRPLLTALFDVFSSTGQKPNPYVIRAIMRVVSKGKEKVGALISVVLDQLGQLLRAVILNPQSPVFNHYVFESLAALIGCAAAAGGPQGIGSLEQAVLPMFQNILQQDLQEFSGYVFQLIAQLVGEHTEGVPDKYWALFPSLMSPGLWMRPGNVPALTRLVGQYITRGAAHLASNEQLMTNCLGVWQHLNSTTKHDSETFELLGYLSDYMPLQVLDKFLARILSFVFARLDDPKGKTQKYVKGYVTWAMQFCVKHGGSALMQRCVSVKQSSWMDTLKLVGESMSKPRTSADKKRCALGVVNLLTATNEMLAEPQVRAWGPLLLALMGLLELPEEDEADGPSDDVEISGGAVFTPLFHSGIVSDKDPYPGVNEKAELAKGLASLNQKQGGKVMAMVQRSLPAEAGQKLQGYFAAAQIRI